jgi:hypothetical protein
MAPGPAPARPAPMRVPTTERAQPARIPRERIAFLALLAIVVTLAVVFASKRFGGGGTAGSTALAGAGSAPAPEGASVSPGGGSPQAAIPPQPAALAPSVGNTAHDRAFLDKQNKVTIRVARYDNDDNGNKLARDTYKFLYGEGVPVVQPIVSGDRQHLIVCVDAKPKIADLTELRDWIRKMRGPASGKKQPYSDAFVDNIDNVLLRP